MAPGDVGRNLSRTRPQGMEEIIVPDLPVAKQCKTASVSAMGFTHIESFKNGTALIGTRNCIMLDQNLPVSGDLKSGIPALVDIPASFKFRTIFGRNRLAEYLEN